MDDLATLARHLLNRQQESLSKNQSPSEMAQGQGAPQSGNTFRHMPGNYENLSPHVYTAFAKHLKSKRFK